MDSYQRYTVRICLLSAFTFLCLNMLTVDGEATAQIRRASLEELTRSSSDILVGKATRKASAWNEEHTKIYTQVTIQVDERMKGQAGSEMVITVPGGRVGNTLYEVSDMPVFVEGEQVVVFIRQHPSGSNLVTGAALGKMTVVEDAEQGQLVVRHAPQLLRSLIGVEYANPSGQQGIPLENIRQAVRSIEEQ